jgi:hypothetical protein
MNDIMGLCDTVRETGFAIHRYHRSGHLEKIFVVEIKAVRAVLDEHVAQLLGYLRSSRMEHGLLVNFGAPQFHIKKYILNDVFPA